MTATMTISDPKWTIEATAETFAESEIPEVARHAADTAHAWLVNNVGQEEPGWSYANGVFTLPATNWSNQLDKAMWLITEANDYAAERLDEIRNEYATA